MDNKLLERCYLESKVVMRGDYPYFVNSVSDGNPEMTRELLEEITDNIISVADLDCDLILAPEAMGIQYAAALTLKTGIPFKIIRKRAPLLDDEILFNTSTGYSKSEMLLSSTEPGTRVAIIDDVVSTGGTLKGLVKVLRDNGIVVTEIIAIYNKSKDLDALAREMGVPIRFLLKVAVKDGKPVIL